MTKKIVFACALALAAMPFSSGESIAAAPYGVVGQALGHAGAERLEKLRVLANLRIFSAAAQKWAFENVGSVPWNQNQSLTPISYAPFVVYAGSSSAACGAPAGSGQAVPIAAPMNLAGVVNPQPMANPVSWSAPDPYLPGNWNPAFHGTFCAVVWLNQPAAQEATLQSYYVSNNGTASKRWNVTLAPNAVASEVALKVQMLMQQQPMQTMWQANGSPAGSGISTAAFGSDTPTTTLGSGSTASKWMPIGSGMTSGG